MIEEQEGEGGVEVQMYLRGNWRFVFTAGQVAKCLDFNVGYIRQLCDTGQLIATKYNGRWWIENQQYKNTYVDILPFTRNLP